MVSLAPFGNSHLINIIMSEYDFEKLNNPTENTTEGVRKGNVLVAFLAGLFSCIVVSSIVAFITFDTEKQWLLTGLAAAYVVGKCVNIVSGGNNNTIGFIGALFALLSCVLGYLFANVGFIAKNEGMTFFQTLGALDFSNFFEIAFLDFGFFSIFIYGTAAVVGWVIGRG